MHIVNSNYMPLSRRRIVSSEQKNDKAKTPYRRLMESSYISDAKKLYNPNCVQKIENML